MKCPHCGASFSHLRDICPHCLVDLREFKHAQGFPVSFPKASYEFLLQKLGVSPEVTAPPSPSSTDLPQEAEFDLEFETERSPESTPLEASPASLESRSELAALCDSAASSIAERSSTRAFDLGLAQLVTFDNREDLRLLFMLADEAIKDPSSLEKYQEVSAVERTTEIESEDLTSELRQVESRINAPQLSLKTPLPGKQRDSTLQSSIDIPAEPIVPAPFFKRICAMLLDLAIVLILGAVFSFTTLLAAFPSTEIFGPEARFIDTLLFFKYMGISSLVFLVLYPFLSLVIFGTTLGKHSSHLVVRTDKGGPAGISQILIRSSLMPLSFVCGGYFPLLLKGRAFHELLSRTWLSCGASSLPTPQKG